MHDTQKNLLVFGVTDPATLRALPVVGNPAAGVYGWQSLFDALPVLLVIPGVVLAAQARPSGSGWAVAPSWSCGAARGCSAPSLRAVGIVAAIRGWPFVSDRHPTWQAAGLTPYRELIDGVEQAGGAAVWSFPEAVDRGEQRVGPVRVGWLTEPYSDDLLRTFRYSAFGAIYEDTTTFEQPGGGWDRLLGEYARGERTRAAWAPGRVRLPRAERGQADRSAADGVSRARQVPRRRAGGAPPGTDVRRAAHARPRLRRRGVRGRRRRRHRWGGETLRVPAGTPIELSIAVEASDGKSTTSGWR